MNTSEHFLEVLMQNNQKVYVGREDSKLIIKNSQNETIHLELDPIALPYLLKLCVNFLSKKSDQNSVPNISIITKVSSFLIAGKIRFF